MKAIFSVFAVVLMLAPGCVSKKPVLDGDYNLVTVMAIESGEMKYRGTDPLGNHGRLRLKGDSYDFTWIGTEEEALNFKGRFSVDGSKLRIESVFYRGLNIPLREEEHFVFEFVFIQKDEALYLELTLPDEKGSSNNMTLEFRKK